MYKKNSSEICKTMTYDDIVDGINFNRIKLFEGNEFLIANSNLKNPTSFTLSVSLDALQSLVSLDINTNDNIFGIIRQEVSQSVNSEIFSKLFGTRKFEYLDLSKSGGISGTTYRDQRSLYNLIVSSNEGYSNIISNGYVAASLQDLPEYTSKIRNIQRNNYSDYGRLFMSKNMSFNGPDNINIWVDPYMTYNDTRLVMFSNVEFNFTNLCSSVVVHASFTPSIEIKYDLSINVGDSKVIFVIDNESSDIFRKYKSIQRDLKIDNVLDEEE